MKPIPPLRTEPLANKKTLHTLIERRASLILTPLEAFVRKQAAAGILLIITIAVALLMANSPWTSWLPAIGSKAMGGYLGDYAFSMTLLEWIGDGLLALFFFMVGLEIKREVLIGDLRHPKHALLVIVAAVGGYGRTRGYLFTAKLWW